MSYIASFFGGLLRLLFKSWRVLPKGMLSLFIFITFFIELFTKGFSYAFTHLAKSTLGAGLVINENVHLAVANSPDYTLLSFVNIVSSLMVLYYLTKFITAVLIGITGAQARASAMFVSVIIVAIIQISAISVLEGGLGYIPIRDDLWFLFRNIVPVLQNIHFI